VAPLAMNLAAAFGLGGSKLTMEEPFFGSPGALEGYPLIRFR